jgi:ABC-2 type transport system ATP-binding protein
VEFLQKVNTSQLKKIRHVKRVNALSERRWELFSGMEQDIRKDIFDFAVANGLTLIEMQKQVFSVEDVFQQLTK